MEKLYAVGYYERGEYEPICTLVSKKLEVLELLVKTLQMDGETIMVVSYDAKRFQTTNDYAESDEDYEFGSITYNLNKYETHIYEA